ncbi:hypothetical protein PTKIN_Ptkin03bG0054300 [Pterospermum kingtungense]
MKLLSSSSSSSSAVSFDPKMCTSKSAPAGCLAGLLRRILCSGSLPTHPSDHITDQANSVASNYTKQQVIADEVKFDAPKVTPGIVARLMGLDSLPEMGLLKTQVNPNSITRSRSMNSAEYNKQDTDTIHGKHTRVNSTLSFREMPTYLELENEEFFILSFEKGSERKELRSKGRKCKGGSEELKQIKEDKENRVLEKVSERTNKEDHQQATIRVLKVLNEEKLNRRILEKPNKDIAKSSEAVIVKGHETAAKLRKKKMKLQHHLAQIVEPECISEDCSPVSVLDFDQFITDHDVPTSSEEDLNPEGSNSRRKLSPALENHGCKSPTSNDGNLKEDDQRVNIIEGKNLVSREKDCHSRKNLECWSVICRMAEAEVAKSSWLCSKNEDITADFGSTILDQLLDELVVQLFGSYMGNFNL